MNLVTIEIIVLFLLTIANGYFAMSEMAIISSRKSRLQQMAEKGNKGAHIALELAEKPTRFLSTIQIGITTISIITGAIGASSVSGGLAVQFDKVPWLAPISHPLAIVLVIFLITFITLVLGELFPKRIGLTNAEKIAAGVAPTMLFISRIATPLVRLLSGTTEGLLRLFGIKSSKEPGVTEEEVRVMIDEGTQGGVFEEEQQDMVERVFRLNDRSISSLMTHRSEMVWLDVNDPLKENFKKIMESGYSNFLVSKEELDNVVGYVRTKDLLARYFKDEPIDLKAAVKTPLYVPEATTALETVEKLRNEKAHFALVVDEYGSIAGVVTLTDVLQAIVGDIPWVDNEGEPEFVEREDGSWLVDGKMAVDDLEMLLDVDELPEEEANYETVGGLIMAHYDRIPVAGDCFEWNNLSFEVMDMDGHRVDKVLVVPMDKSGKALPTKK
jgi:putative hemolysin